MSYSSVLLSYSPACWFRLGEPSGSTMTDSSGNGRNGTYTAATLAQTSLLTGDADTAVSLTSSTSQGQVAYGSWMNSATITVIAWVKRSSATVGVVGARDIQSGTRVWQTQITAAGELQFQALQSGIPTAITTGANLNDGNRHMLAWVFDGVGSGGSHPLRLYVDGVANGTGSTASNLPQPAGTPITVGNTNRTTTSPINGVMDEFAYFTTLLSPSDILAIYNAGANPGPGDPTSVVASGATATTVDLSWSAPVSGGTVTSYEVRANGGPPSTQSSPYTFTGLTPSTSYTLEVRAVGPGGSSGWVSDTESTLGAPPGVPTSVAADPDVDTIELSWAAPVSGGTVTSYEVRLDGGTPSTQTSPYTFTGLTSDTAYDLEVRAVGPDGSSSWVLVSVSTDVDGPTADYWAKVRIGSHFWEIEYADPADPDAPEVLAGATFVWTAPDNVGWPPPMWLTARDNVKLRIRVPVAEDVSDVRRGDTVRFKFVPEGYDFAHPLVDFAGPITGDPVITDDPGGGVFLDVVASDWRYLLTNWTVPGETIIGEAMVDTAEDALQTLSAALDSLNAGQVPGAFGDVTVGAVDPRGWLGGTLAVDVGVPDDSEASAMSLFAGIGLLPIPQYDDDGDLDLVQPFRIVETDPYGVDFETAPAIPANLVPNPSVNWRSYFTTEYLDLGAAGLPVWAGGVTGDILKANIRRVRLLTDFNYAGFTNELPEADPWTLYAFSVLAYLDSETVRDWFVYPQRVRQYITVDGAELIKNPSGTDTVSGMLKAASLTVAGRGKWFVTGGMRPHSFNII